MATPLKLPVSMRTATKGASLELRDAQEGSSDDSLGRSLHPAGKETLHPGNGTVVRSGRGRQLGRPGVLPPFEATAVPVRGQGDTRRQPRRRLRRTGAGAEMPRPWAIPVQKYPVVSEKSNPRYRCELPPF